MSDPKPIREYAVSVAVYREELTGLLTNMKKRGVNKYTTNYLEERQRIANNIHSSIRECHVKICATLEIDELANAPYTNNQVYETAIEAFEAVDAHITDHLSRLEENGPAANSSGSSHDFGIASSVRLPKIELPKFSGNYTEWSTFYDTFRSMIHDNAGLPGIQKFHYLKSYLTGEARMILQALIVSGENYATAWSTLVSRYENKRIITATLMNKLTQIATIGVNNLDPLKALRDTDTVTLDALRNLDYEVEKWDPLIVHMLVNKSEPTLRMEWERAIRDHIEYPTYKQLSDFVSAKVNMLESLNLGRSSVARNSHDKRVKSHAVGFPDPRCVQCGKDHPLHKCERFLNLNPSARLKFVQNKKLCVNCLRSSHVTSACRSQFRCRKCTKLHHSLLHLEKVSKPDSECIPNPNLQTDSPSGEPIPVGINTHLSISDSRTVLLATLLVKVRSGNGRNIVARGLVDPGSEASFLTQNLAQLLRVKQTPVHAAITGVTGKNSHRITSEAEVELHSLKGRSSKITTYVPVSYSSVRFPRLRPRSLADPYANSRAAIDFLIGADYYPQLMTNQSMQSPDRTLLAQSTIFGWIVSGVLPAKTRSSTLTVQHCCELDRSVAKFWELEEVPKLVHWSDEDKECEKNFLETIEQRPDGRFMVGLPLRSKTARLELGTSRTIAELSLPRVIKRWNNQPKKGELYARFLYEYESLGHMTNITATISNPDSRIYLPHHAVFKTENGIEKIRVVFNASSKTTSGLSVNDILLPGPKLQLDITAILMNWRSYRYVVVTDIVKMFRQILIRPQDRCLQNIVWQISGETQHFELNTVTYGTRPAPFLAMRVLKELALRHGDEFPDAQQVLLNSVYVDDLFFGADSLQKLETVRAKMVQLLARGGFELSKWAANVREISAPESVVQPLIFQDSDEITHKVLGINWNPVEDNFNFQIATKRVLSVTKRVLLSENSRIFDQMGWISPVTIVLKQLMQSTWLLKLAWDEEVPEPIRSKWLGFYNQLCDLQQVNVPRWDHYQHKGDTFELIGFCDASTQSYGAVVYAKVTNPNGHIAVSLVMAKSKVAPLKTVSIPRLELVAAALLTKLILHIQSSLARSIHAISCFTDSQITLAWIAQPPTRWKVFVANRVSYIQTELPEAKWHYVNTRENPADHNPQASLRTN